MELMATVEMPEPLVNLGIDEEIDESDELYIPYTPSFAETLATGTESHVYWLLVSCLMRNIVSRFDAVIFGGAVRDTILHSHAAGKF